MTKKKNGFLIIILWTIVCFVSIELLYYFIFVFKPIDRILNKSIGTGSESAFPTTSDLFTSVYLSPLLSKSDDQKVFYSDRLVDFKNSLDSEIKQSNGSFVKFAESNYVVGGTITDIKKITKNNKAADVEYELTLDNSYGDKYLLKLNDVDVKYMKVYARTITIADYSRRYTSLDNLKSGDFFVMKKSTNLLNPSEINIEAEILRYSK